jgi:hypothetical protein
VLATAMLPLWRLLCSAPPPDPHRVSPVNERTKAELVELAQPLQIEGASRMTKDELVRAVQSASRVGQRS